MNALTEKDSIYYSSDRTDMLRFIDIKPTAILDIGCGEGNFSAHFPHCEYLGIEPNPTMVKKARSYGRTVFQGDYDEIAGKIPNDHFDLIVCNDVIEHMIDPIGFLQNIQQKIIANGKLIVSLPNIRNIVPLYDLLIHGEFTYTQAGLLDYTHLHLFTMKSFTKIATNCGWDIETCEPTRRSTDISFLKTMLIRFAELFLGDLRTYQFAVRAKLNNSNNSKHCA